MPKSPTQRALAILRGHDYVAAVTEQWNPHARVRQDLFGFCDVLAVRPGTTLAVQATSASNVASRFAKLTDTETPVGQRVWDCLRAGWRIEVWGLRQKADRHGSKLKARTLVLEEDGSVRIAECSLAIEGSDQPVAF